MVIIVVVDNGISTKISKTGRWVVAKSRRGMPIAWHLLNLLWKIWTAITSMNMFFTTTIFTLRWVQIKLLMCYSIRVRGKLILTPLRGVTPLIK